MRLSKQSCQFSYESEKKAERCTNLRYPHPLFRRPSHLGSHRLIEAKHY